MISPRIPKEKRCMTHEWWSLRRRDSRLHRRELHSLTDPFRTRVTGFLQTEGYPLTLEETADIKAVWECDVAYVTRIQEERFPDHKEYERLKDLFKINKELILASKKDTTILHPLPRVNELSTDVDDLPNAAYFRQARYGVVSRMTLLCLSLGQDF
ncbi:aspartate/ornithine carbamoyltransferase, Asp/Orn-binding domain protein [Leptospira santarosai str. HAI134]|nr:aspartate/ornithine carbamoyltransferase, Asp/Orn-binding domain protein [Leptospira santarosai str. HAI134]